jgi:hypothetical protein
MSKHGSDLREYVEKSRGDTMHEEFIQRVKGGKSQSIGEENGGERGKPSNKEIHTSSTANSRQEPDISSYANSLDMLEESLLIAYSARKTAITQRMAKSKSKIHRNARNSRRAVKSSQLRSFDDHDNDDEENDSPSVSVPPPQVTAKPPPLVKQSSQSSMPPSLVKQSSQSSMKAAGSPQSKQISSAFSTLDEQRHDIEAAEIFEAFKKDLAYWWKTNTTKRTDEDVRGDVADDMTERYLCQRLDPLPASRVVTHIRKSVSQIIEHFAERGELSPELSGERGVESAAPVTKYAQKKAADDAAAAAAAEEKEKQRKAALEKSSADRAAADKKRMKEQYEQYMALKKKAAVHEDNAKEVEIEGHLDDIRSLISSIKGGGAPAPPK